MRHFDGFTILTDKKIRQDDHSGPLPLLEDSRSLTNRHAGIQITITGKGPLPQGFRMPIPRSKPRARSPQP